MSAALLEAEVMAQPEGERLSYALGLLAFYLDPKPMFYDGLVSLGLRVTGQEARILHALDRRRGQLVSLQALHAAAMGDRPLEEWSDPRTVYARLGSIRAELTRLSLPVQIHAWPGMGYRLSASDEFSFSGAADA